MYRSDTGNIEVYSDDASLGGTNHEILIESFLTNYPQIIGKNVSYIVKFFEGTGVIKADPYIVASNLPPELKADPPQITILVFDKSTGNAYKETKILAAL